MNPLSSSPHDRPDSKRFSRSNIASTRMPLVGATRDQIIALLNNLPTNRRELGKYLGNVAKAFQQPFFRFLKIRDDAPDDGMLPVVGLNKQEAVMLPKLVGKLLTLQDRLLSSNSGSFELAEPEVMMYSDLIDEYVALLSALSDINSPRFPLAMLRVYFPDYMDPNSHFDLEQFLKDNESNEKLMKKILARTLEMEDSSANSFFIPASKVIHRCKNDSSVVRLNQELARFGCKPITFTLSSDISAPAHTEGQEILVGAKPLRLNLVPAVVQHEGLHALTAASGACAQGTTLFKTGVAGYDSLQESLAIMAELMTCKGIKNRVRDILVRALETLNFLKAYSERDFSYSETSYKTTHSLERHHGLAPDSAMDIRRRIFRAGGYPGFLVYPEGLMRLVNFWRNGGSLEDAIRYGKISFSLLENEQAMKGIKTFFPPNQKDFPIPDWAKMTYENARLASPYLRIIDDVLLEKPHDKEG